MPAFDKEELFYARASQTVCKASKEKLLIRFEKFSGLSATIR